MKPNHETIYLVPTDYDGGQLTYSWCDTPAPGEGMREEDATRYVREDIYLALQAQVEQLRDALDDIYTEAQKHVGDYAKFNAHTSNQALLKTPNSCLDSVKNHAYNSGYEDCFLSVKDKADRICSAADKAGNLIGFLSHHFRGRLSDEALIDMAEKADELIAATVSFIELENKR